MSGQGGTTLVMLSGARVDLLAPDWREIRLTDVAHGLAAIRRWNGQAYRHISDVDHSLRVESLVAPRLRLPALLHDGQEYIIGDLIVPLMNALIAILGAKVAFAIEDMKYRLDVAICRRVLHSFGPAQYETTEEAEAHKLAQEMRSPDVKHADQMAAEIENRARGVVGQPDPIELPRALPDISAADAWIEHVKLACVERYSGVANG